ncbi:hypothetical protein V7024_17660 [Bacillus sp. JJ864]
MRSLQETPGGGGHRTIDPGGGWKYIGDPGGTGGKVLDSDPGVGWDKW